MASDDKAKAPAFQFYPKDFLSDPNVMGMSYEERGVYITLLSICWLEGSLPLDLAKLARILGMTPKSFGKLWPGLCLCFDETSEGFVHPRLEKERAKQNEWRDKSRKGGQLGAAKRWKADRGGHGLVKPPDDIAVCSLQSASPSAEKDIGGKPPRAKRWKIVPDDWQPTDQHRALAKELGVDLQKQLVLFREHEFRDYKTDANRTFNTWLRRAKDFAGNKAPVGSEASRFTASTERRHYQAHAESAGQREGQQYVTEAERVTQWIAANKDEAQRMLDEIKAGVVEKGEDARRLVIHTLHQRIVREKLMKVVA